MRREKLRHLLTSSRSNVDRSSFNFFVNSREVCETGYLMILGNILINADEYYLQLITITFRLNTVGMIGKDHNPPRQWYEAKKFVLHGNIVHKAKV